MENKRSQKEAIKKIKTKRQAGTSAHKHNSDKVEVKKQPEVAVLKM